MAVNRLSLLSDQAIGESGGSRKDGLGFDAYAEVLAGAVLGTEGPFTIGIFGEWGTGKTSLMRMIEEHLKKEDSVVTVWFNAWRHEQDEHPIVPLVATIIRALELRRSLLDKLGESGKSLVRALRAVAYGFSGSSNVSIPGFAEVEASFVARDMIEREEKLISDPLLDRSLYYDAFERLSEVKAESKTKIAVIVDDLDRCFPDRAIKLLESIKLVLWQPGFVFVLGVSRKVIEGYLEHRYEKQYGISGFEGRQYLDKIVQLPFYIPPHRERMEDFSVTLAKRLQEYDQKALSEVLPIVAVACGSNPRSTVRFVNNLLIDRAINTVLAKQDLMEPIPTGYFAVSRSLQQRWNEMFSVLVRSEDLCRKVLEWENQELLYHTTSDDVEEVELASKLLADRNLRALLYSEPGKQWLSDSPGRGAAVQFLDKRRQIAGESPGRVEFRGSVLLICGVADVPVVMEVADILALAGTASMFIPRVRERDKLMELVRRSDIDRAMVFVGPDGPPSLEGMRMIEMVDALAIPVVVVALPGVRREDIPAELRWYVHMELPAVESVYAGALRRGFTFALAFERRGSGADTVGATREKRTGTSESPS